MSETDWQARAETAEARVSELAAERARLWEDNVHLRAALREREHREVERSERRRQQLRAPLRFAKRVVKAILGRT